MQRVLYTVPYQPACVVVTLCLVPRNVVAVQLRLAKLLCSSAQEALARSCCTTEAQQAGMHRCSITPVVDSSSGNMGSSILRAPASARLGCTRVAGLRTIMPSGVSSPHSVTDMVCHQWRTWPWRQAASAADLLQHGTLVLRWSAACTHYRRCAHSLSCMRPIACSDAGRSRHA
jgi:hypothetical protein